MKALKQVLTLMALTIAAVALLGCGVTKEEHEKTVSELNEARAELEQANAKIAELEKSMNEAGIRRPGLMGRLGDTGAQEKLAAAQQEVASLRARVQSLTSENSRLQGLLESARSQLSDFQAKLEGFQSPTKNLSTDILKKQ